MTGDRPIVVVTVDTEEDNWFPSREGITVDNIRGVERFQRILDRFGVCPTYLTTYEVASRPWAIDLLLDIERSGRAEVGAHLHPWNTPPLEEEFNSRNTGWKHLAPGLQRRKLRALTDTISAARGTPPTAFRAGRWSIDREGMRALIELGYETDSSVLPYTYWFDVKDSPNFPRAPDRPYFQDGVAGLQSPLEAGPLVEIPATVGFSRGPWRWWGPVDRLLNEPLPRLLHAIGILARLRLIEKLALSPEISTLGEMRRLTDVVLQRRLPVLNLFLHSGSLVPGKSPYVKAPSELEEFLARVEGWLEWVARRTAFESLTLTEAGRRVRHAAAESEAPEAPVA